MRVHTRNLLILSAVILAISLAYGIGAQYFLIGGIQEIETKEITDDLTRAATSIDDLGTDLSVFSEDYAMWDDTYAYATDRNQAYIESNLVPSTFSGLGVEAILYYDTAGDLFYASSYDPETEEKLPVSPHLTTTLATLPPISSPAYADEACSGLLSAPDGIWAIAVEPILTSDGDGPSRGHLVMASRFTADTVDRIAAETGLAISVTPLTGFSPLFSGTPVAGDTGDISIQTDTGKHTVTAETVLTDITGNPVLSLSVSSQRETYHLGQMAVMHSLALFLLVLILCGGFVYLYIGRHLTRRIETISDGVRHIADANSYQTRLRDDGNDELTTIVRSVNCLLDTIGKNLSEIEEAGRALEDSERKYRHLFDAAGEAIFILDRTGILECNRAAEEMIGSGEEEICGKQLHDFLGTCANGPDGTDLSAQTEAAYSGSPRHVTCEHHVDTDASRHFSVSLSRFSDTQNVYLLAIVRDITAFVQNKERLRMTQFSVDHADDAIYWVRKDGSVIYANTAASQSLGYTPEELVGLKTWDVNQTITPDTWPSVWDRIVAGSLMHEESYLLRADATVFPIAQTTSYFSIRGEEFICIHVRDITETVRMRKREQEALRQIEENLVSLAILNDHIRNPLTIIAAKADLQEEVVRETILSQVDEIDEIIRKLDQRWLESAKIRDFLIRHYDFEKTLPQDRDEDGDEDKHKDNSTPDEK